MQYQKDVIETYLKSGVVDWQAYTKASLASQLHLLRWYPTLSNLSPLSSNHLCGAIPVCVSQNSYYMHPIEADIQFLTKQIQKLWFLQLKIDIK